MTLRFVNSMESHVLLPENILDIYQNRLITGKAIAVKNGIIAHFLSREEVPAWVARENGKVVSLPGLTLMPGLVDCHVHFALDSVDFSASLARWTEKEALSRQVDEIADHFLRGGVLAVRDGGDKEGVGLYAKKRLKNGLIVQATGWALRKNGFYGSFLGPGAESVHEVKAQIGRLVQLGVDQIKLIVSGIVSFSHYGKVGSVPFNLRELKEIVDECHSQGKKVMAHASSDEGVKWAVEAGVDSIEHGYFLSDQAIQMMKERGTAWVPTVIPVQVQTRAPYSHAHDQEGLSVIKKTYIRQMEQIKNAVSQGILLGIGTDAGAIGARHGFSYLEELELFKQAGLTSEEVLKAAIIGGGKIAGLEEGWGKMQPGGAARLIAVRGNPLQDLSSLSQVQMIVQPQDGQDLFF